MKRLNIHIHKLGPVRNAKIELAPAMIFTGASNLGKSYTNFLTYYIFNLFSGDRLTDFFRARMPGKADFGNFIMMEATVNDTGIVFFSRNDEITENTARHIAGYLQEALLDVHINRACLLPPPGRASLLNESFSVNYR